MQRLKGKAGECEAAGLVRDLTGWDVHSRVRQHDGGSGLVGVPSWSDEVKHRRSATDVDRATCWLQPVAHADGSRPVRLRRFDGGEWRGVRPLAALLAPAAINARAAYRWTANSSVDAWSAVARDRLDATPMPDTPHGSTFAG